MPPYTDLIAQDWRRRAEDLAAWAMAHLVNRTDVWGLYLAERNRKVASDGKSNKAITAPFRDERGKVFLGQSSLAKHFKATGGGGILGLHSVGADWSSRWLASTSTCMTNSI